MSTTSVRERVAIVFMTMSVIATLVLGAALVAQLGRPREQVTQGAVAPSSEPGEASSGDGAVATDEGVGSEPAGGATGTTAAARTAARRR